MLQGQHSKRQVDIQGKIDLYVLQLWAGTFLQRMLLGLLFLHSCKQSPLGRPCKYCSSSLLLPLKTFHEGKRCLELQNHQQNKSALPDTATFFLTQLGNKYPGQSNAGNQRWTWHPCNSAKILRDMRTDLRLQEGKSSRLDMEH